MKRKVEILLRFFHVVFWHPYSGSKQVDGLTSEKHYATDEKYIYTVNIRQCKCGLTFLDDGMESRKKITKK